MKLKKFMQVIPTDEIIIILNSSEEFPLFFGYTRNIPVKLLNEYVYGLSTATNQYCQKAVIEIKIHHDYIEPLCDVILVEMLAYMYGSQNIEIIIDMTLCEYTEEEGKVCEIRNLFTFEDYKDKEVKKIKAIEKNHKTLFKLYL